jgi:CrcB protein
VTPGLFFVVALAGGCGAAARYAFDFYVTQRTPGALPWGTAAVNVSGALLLGFIASLAAPSGPPFELWLVFGGGFLGAYTTFSTWMYETLRLLEDGAWRVAALNVLGSLIAGVVASVIGWGIGRWILSMVG